MLTLIIGITLLLLGLFLLMPYPLNTIFIIIGIILIIWSLISLYRWRTAADQRGRWRW